MNRFRLYIDEDAMHHGLAEGLRARGVDAVTAAEAGMVNRDDKDHLEFAANGGRTVYTFNLVDFVVLHQQWLTEGRTHAGIIVGRQRQRYKVGEQIRRLLKMSLRLSREEMRDRLEYLTSWGE